MALNYATTTLAQLKTQLSQRLGDSSKVYWVDAELELYIQLALRMWNSLSLTWKQRYSLTVGATPVQFLDLSTIPASGDSQVPIGRTITDAYVCLLLEYLLLEPATFSSWTGTDMYSMSDITNAIRNARDNFLRETVTVLENLTIPVSSPYIGRVTLPDEVLVIHRAEWAPKIGSTTGEKSVLFRSDPLSATTTQSNWALDPNQPPFAFSVTAESPLSIQLIPHPQINGELTVTVQQAGTTVNPPSANPLGVFTDWVWVIVFGAMMELLTLEGAANDPARAAGYKQLWDLGIAAAKLNPSIAMAQANDKPLITSSIFDIDVNSPTWPNETPGEPIMVGQIAHNLVAFSPPAQNCGLSFDLFRAAPVPSSDSEFVQVDAAHLKHVLNIAQFLGMCKSGAAEMQMGLPLISEAIEAANAHRQMLDARATLLTKLLPLKEFARAPIETRTDADK